MDVFYSLCPPDFTSKDEAQELVTCIYQGVRLYARDLGRGNYEVQRIVSSEPKDFARADIAPGAVIKM